MFYRFRITDCAFGHLSGARRAVHPQIGVGSGHKKKDFYDIVVLCEVLVIEVLIRLLWKKNQV